MHKTDRARRKGVTTRTFTALLLLFGLFFSALAGMASAAISAENGSVERTQDPDAAGTAPAPITVAGLLDPVIDLVEDLLGGNDNQPPAPPKPSPQPPVPQPQPNPQPPASQPAPPAQSEPSSPGTTPKSDIVVPPPSNGNASGGSAQSDEPSAQAPAVQVNAPVEPGSAAPAEVAPPNASAPNPADKANPAPTTQVIASSVAANTGPITPPIFLAAVALVVVAAALVWVWLRQKSA